MTIDIKQYKHIIWDFNGTLFDDAKLGVEILNIFLKKRKLPKVTLSQYQADFFFPIKKYYEMIGFDFSKESYHSVANDFMSIYNKRRFECKLQKNAINVLQALSDLSITQSILSAYKQPPLKETVKFLGIQKFFSEIIGLNDYMAESKIAIGKSHLEQLTHHPKRILFIGDTTHDFEVAQEIGVDCLLIPSGHNTKERLIRCPTNTIGSLTELLIILK